MRFHQPIRSLSVIEKLPLIHQRPILFIFGASDRLVGSEAQELLFQAAQEPKQRWLVPEAGHGQAQQQDPSGFENAVTDFFKKAFLSL